MDAGSFPAAQQTALLVYDMQEGIAGRLPGAQPVIERAAGVLDAARRAKRPIFFSRHMSLPKEVTGASGLRAGMALARVSRVEDYQPAFLRDSPGFPILEALAPQPSEAVLDKLGMSFFVGTPLDQALRDLGVSAFAIIGAVLEIGIAPTVWQGADRGYLPIVIDDACLSLSDQARTRTRESLERLCVWTDSTTFSRSLQRSAPGHRLDGAQAPRCPETAPEVGAGAWAPARARVHEDADDAAAGVEQEREQ